MEIKPRITDISMVPGDNIRITVGINYVCEVSIKPDGTLRVYYGNGKCLEP